MRGTLLTLVLLLHGGAAIAQEKPSAAPVFLFRLERLTAHDNACALMKQDGSYELEESSGDNRRVFHGQLPLAELAIARQHIDNPAIKGLRQDEIDRPLMRTAEFEQVVLSVVREGGWQNLNFPARDSWAPIKNEVEPLLRQLKQMRRWSSEELPEARANNCNPPLPAGSLKLRTREEQRSVTTAASTTAPSALASSPTTISSSSNAPNSAFLLAVRTDRMKDLTMERQCILVRPDGTFRWEKASQKYGGHVTAEAFEGALPPEHLKDLHRLLADPQLVAAKMPPDTGGGITFSNLELTFFFISRPEKLQELFAGQAFVLRGMNASAPDRREFGDKLVLQPLIRWTQSLEGLPISKAGTHIGAACGPGPY